MRNPHGYMYVTSWTVQTDYYQWLKNTADWTIRLQTSVVMITTLSLVDVHVHHYGVPSVNRTQYESSHLASWFLLQQSFIMFSFVSTFPDTPSIPLKKYPK